MSSLLAVNGILNTVAWLVLLLAAISTLHQGMESENKPQTMTGVILTVLISLKVMTFILVTLVGRE